MFKKRDAQSFSFTVIVVAILALIILLVAFNIVSKKSGYIATNLDTCGSRGGVCTDKDCDLNTETKISDVDCPPAKFCCIKIFV